MTTLAGKAGTSGSTDGIGTNAKFNQPTGIVVNPFGTLLYVADSFNNAIRAIALFSGKTYTYVYILLLNKKVIITLSLFLLLFYYILIFGVFHLILLALACFLALLINLFVIYLGQVSTIAGTTTSGSNDGIGTNARFNYPIGMAFDPLGTMLYIGAKNNNAIRALSLSSGNTIMNMLTHT